MRHYLAYIMLGLTSLLGGCHVGSTEALDLEEESDGEDTAEAEQAASAPPLTYFQIKGVYSSSYPNNGYGEQPISDGALSTAQDHGGNQLFILTREIGYGHQTQMKINGVSIPLDELIPICNGGPCSPGMTVTGWWRWWDASGHQGGNVTCQNTSLNFPTKTWTDQIYIW